MLIKSFNPATEELLYDIKVNSSQDIDHAIAELNTAQHQWRMLPINKRIHHIKDWQTVLQQRHQEIATAISQENGKTLTESLGEVKGAIAKIDLSLQAYQPYSSTTTETQNSLQLQCTHKPIGVLAVLGPFNFPFHLPMGHIVPGLLAGNAMILKPSEHTPGIGKLLYESFVEARFPYPVLSCIQGGKDQGQALAVHPDIHGILFTGSYQAAQSISIAIAHQPEKLFAMECGGNNPLIISSYSDQQKVVDCILQSSFLTSGQRCTCTRRLIVIDHDERNSLIEAVCSAVPDLSIGPYTADPEPFMGPLITQQARDTVLHTFQDLTSLGGTPLCEPKCIGEKGFFVSPGIIDTSSCWKDIPDKECFGPLMQVIHASTLEHAIDIANHTAYGLSASLISKDKSEFEQVHQRVNAGLINWNRPTNGSSSRLPFGGVGFSGNFRPAGYSAIESCIYPVSSVQNSDLL